ncbi:MAG: hypothetical protein M1426_02760 [Patescibacteria group bacterium]|nr:hypothetical protein [Patescibacteria group bacterium]
MLRIDNKTSSSSLKGVGLECVMEPNPAISIVYPDDGQTYYKIKGPTAIPLVEIVERDGYRGHFDHPYTPGRRYYKLAESSVIHQDAKGKLVYEDVTSSVSPKIPGFAYFEIYLKKGENIPASIKNFCDSGQPINPRTILPDEHGQSFPPVKIDASQIQQSIDPLPEGTYYLFAYEAMGSESFDKVTAGSKPGTIEVEFNGKKKTYKTFYNNGAEVRGHLISLLDDDPTSLDYKIAFKYTQVPEFSPYVGRSDTRIPALSKGLQIKTFSNELVYPWGWWSPECKPAIYLYPKEKTDVRVQVSPAGFLTYTDPKYPEGGWQVTAYPNGQISTNGKNYDYLYYESKIKDSEINKPKEGFVVAFDNLPSFYNQVLPKLGLNAKETKDFKDYWEKYLPESPYYFVGLMDEKSIEKIEPLNVNPAPDSIIRVRFYFEALDKKIDVKEPLISTPVRSGYTLVEWGGLVKVDKDHPFTCSQ